MEEEQQITRGKSIKPESLELWHKRLGHSSVKTVMELASKVNGMRIRSTSKNQINKCKSYDICINSKMPKESLVLKRKVQLDHCRKSTQTYLDHYLLPKEQARNM